MRIVKWLGITAVAVAVVIVGFAMYVARTWDREYAEVPLPNDIHVSTDAAVLARGKYLVYGPAHCIECHGAADALQKLTDGVETPLSGGMRLAIGPMGVVYAANLTPDGDTGIGRYSDGQIARMMRWAVKPNGRATVEPLMPYGNMSQDDLVAIISFLRAQPPVKNAVPSPEWTTLGKVVKSVSAVFKPRQTINPPAVAPPSDATAARGEYLARYVSNCVGCHTPRNQNTFAATGPDFAGGFELEPMAAAGVDPNVWFRAPNITPKDGSALMKFPDRDTFVARFQRGGRQYGGSPMPWEPFARMSNEDLGALYEFLHGLPPQDGPSGDPQVRKN
jgi:mono/diheme cytochrome c family protein